MKHLLSVILIAATVVTAFSTAQFTERINDNGVDKGLTACLLELDSVSFSRLEQRIPEDMVSTALWRRYIGHWKIKNDSLFLDSVLVMNKTSDYPRFVPAKIDDIYAMRRTPSGYFADWVTGTFRVVSGNVVQYEHMGWESYWENEEFVSVKGGLIKDRIIYENRVVNPACEGEIARRKMIDSLNLGFIPKRIILQLGYQGFNEKGDPTGYKVGVMRSCGDTILDNRVVRTFSDSAVMRRLIPIYYIRGQYKSQEWTIPIPARPDSSARIINNAPANYVDSLAVGIMQDTAYLDSAAQSAHYRSLKIYLDSILNVTGSYNQNAFKFRYDTFSEQMKTPWIADALKEILFR